MEGATDKRTPESPHRVRAPPSTHYGCMSHRLASDREQTVCVVAAGACVSSDSRMAFKRSRFGNPCLSAIATHMKCTLPASAPAHNHASPRPARSLTLSSHDLCARWQPVELVDAIPLVRAHRYRSIIQIAEGLVLSLVRAAESVLHRRAGEAWGGGICRYNAWAGALHCRTAVAGLFLAIIVTGAVAIVITMAIDVPIAERHRLLGIGAADVETVWAARGAARRHRWRCRRCRRSKKPHFGRRD
eukprot:5580406-Prymnesium_polylepis.1